MKERPILFSVPMVRAILDGNKTQTRRVVKPHKADCDGICVVEINGISWPYCLYGDGITDANGVEHPIKCPYGSVGDRLWVREAWGEANLLVMNTGELKTQTVYRADFPDGYDMFGISGNRWIPSIHMPRTESRISLEITAIRVERLQDISRKDAKAEGFWPSESNGLEFWNGQSYGNAENAFQACWSDINGKKYPWDSNPWVWVVEFKRIEE